jgi:hypothetical protein
MNVGRIRNGAILLSAGVVLLLNTTGHTPWVVWFKIFSLWPVALIAIGIELLFKKSKLAFVALLSPLLFFAAILGPVFFGGYDYGWYDYGRSHHGSRTYHLSQDFDSTYTGMKVSLRMNSGDLTISSGTEKLISANLDYFSHKPLVDSQQADSGRTINYQIRDKERKWFSGRIGRVWIGRARGRKEWDVRLTDRIPVILNLDLKSGDARLDLSNLKLTECDLDVNNSETDIKIGEMVEEANLTIRSRSSEISLSIPEGIGLRIVNRTNLSSTSFSWLTLEEKGQGYQTPDYEEAPHKLSVSLEGSLTSLKIRKYESFEGI